MGIKVIISLCLMLGACSNISTKKEAYFNEIKYAVSYCLSKTYPNTDFSSDAKYISGAYLQKGDFGIDMYEQLRDFVDAYRMEKYKSNRNLDIMQCMDLYHSVSLADAIREHTKI